ncbi:MAG: hypothetical protein ACD_77C00032G0005 [uncultured bacterium]|nr:MAG: hypothetical protein ACD_77C00032G0005 [uncultured bacterium]
MKKGACLPVLSSLQMLFCLTAVLVFSGCCELLGGDFCDDTPTPEMPTRTHTKTPVPPGPSWTPTKTPAATSTPVPDPSWTPTRTPAATSTPVPGPSWTPTRAPAATSTPVPDPSWTPTRTPVPAYSQTPTPTPTCRPIGTKECEDFSRKQEGYKQPRGNASGRSTWRISSMPVTNSYIEHDFCFSRTEMYSFWLIYSNDNSSNKPTERVQFYMDGSLKGQFVSGNTSVPGNPGAGWNNFFESPVLTLGVVTVGIHTLRLALEPGVGDGYGFEFDVVHVSP